MENKNKLKATEQLPFSLSYSYFEMIKIPSTYQSRFLNSPCWNANGAYNPV